VLGIQVGSQLHRAELALEARRRRPEDGRNDADGEGRENRL